MPSALRIKELRNLSDTVLMSDGALSDNIQFPAGHVIQAKSADFSAASSSDYIVATNSGGQTEFLGLSSNQNRLIGTSSNRVYVEVLNVTINVSDRLNNILVFASTGVDYGNHTDRGAFGFSINVPYSGNAGEAYDFSSYPWYKTINSLGNSTTYPPDWSGHIAVNGSLGYVSTGGCNVKLFGYAYNESGATVSQTLRVRRAELTVMEVQA